MWLNICQLLSARSMIMKSEQNNSTFNLWSHMILRSRGLVGSHDKLKPLYLHYHNAYGDQTLEDGDLPWKASIYKVAWTFSLVVLQDHVITKTIISPLSKCLWTPNLAGWWLTLRGSYPQSSMITWQTIHYISTATMNMNTKQES